jgi:outer membrane receptor protein involved in Fe transport
MTFGADLPPDTVLEPIVVFARGENLVGRADAASEGAVGGADLSVRPLLRVAELLEVVPGLIAAQHSGSGKANQYFLRGFNLDHGTDFTTYIDDVPMNLRTHGHGQGYLDLNGLIPEIVERVDYRKGPYRADVGDFAMAGASYMKTVTEFDKPWLAVESGQYGWGRLAGGGNTPFAGGDLLTVAQLKTYDGPWELKENLKHESAYAKYTRSTGIGELQLSLSGYHATWRPTEQIPERAIGTAVCADQFCALDPTAVGETERWVSSMRLLGDDWRATIYGQYYDWHMYSNPTYDYQIKQFDRRWIAGGRFEKTYHPAPTFDLNLGTEDRYDDIGRVGLDHTDARLFIQNIGDYSVKEGSIALYSEGTWKPIDGVRVLGGLRADRYSFDVTARRVGLLSGAQDSALLSPKLGLAYALNSGLELYANWGRGFHSNDARGVAASALPVRGLVKGTGEEAGARFQFGRFTLTATYWWLDLDSELKFSGDSNSVVPGPATTRHGYELVGFWRPNSWLAFDAVWTGSHARYLNSPGAEFVPGAIESAGELGVSAVRAHWELSARLRYLGPYPLIEDNSLTANGEIMINLRAAWKSGGHYTVYGELLNVLNDNGKDIVYFYAAHVEGLDPPNVEVDGRMSRAEEPRTLRFGLKYSF